MAVVSSTAIGSAQKSAGSLTYRRLRGRTIASQRIVINKSNSAAQQEQRTAFKAVSSAMSIIAPIINQCFERSKFGSSRNNFMKINKSALFLKEVSGELLEVVTPYEVMQRLLLINTELASFYMSYGSANVTVSAMAVGEETIRRSNLDITAYNTVPKNCKCRLINITESGIEVVDKSTEIKAGEYGNVTLALEVTEEHVFSVVVFSVDGALAKIPYVLYKENMEEP